MIKQNDEKHVKVFKTFFIDLLLLVTAVLLCCPGEVQGLLFSWATASEGQD